MELGLLRDFFGNFSTRGEIQPMRGDIEMNIPAGGRGGGQAEGRWLAGATLARLGAGSSTGQMGLGSGQT